MSECRPGHCQLADARAAQVFLQKQLKEAMQRNAELKKRLAKYERATSDETPNEPKHGHTHTP